MTVVEMHLAQGWFAGMPLKQTKQIFQYISNKHKMVKSRCQ